MGAVSLFRPSYVMPGGIQALVDTELLVLRADRVRTMSDRERAMADALMAELSDRVYQFVVELPGASFATVRQRVARHLLDLASDEQRGGTRLVAPVSQQAMADAIGSVREVVVRALGELRKEGLVATGSGGIEILDADRLGGRRVRVACDAGSSARARRSLTRRSAPRQHRPTRAGPRPRHRRGTILEPRLPHPDHPAAAREHGSERTRRRARRPTRGGARRPGRRRAPGARPAAAGDPTRAHGARPGDGWSSASSTGWAGCTPGRVCCGSDARADHTHANARAV